MTSTIPKFTEAQLYAFAWLPSDGSWAIKPNKKASSAVSSLCLFYHGLAQGQVGDFGPRGGLCARYKLTEKGVAIRAALLKENMLPELVDHSGGERGMTTEPTDYQWEQSRKKLRTADTWRRLYELQRDQAERFRFALQMCVEHAKQPDKDQACKIIVQQCESAFHIEKDQCSKTSQ